MKLAGKTAVITGGALGIGLATAKRLVRAGVTVTIWDINKKQMNAALKELDALGGKAFARECDITDKKRVALMAKQAKKDMGRVDILVNNAGYVAGGDFMEVPDEKHEKTISVNLTAMIYTIKAFLPDMYKRNSGSIVNISSAAGTIGVPGLAMYSAVKWAVWGLTEALRHEAANFRKRGVRFSSVHPGYIATGMFQGAKIGGLGGLIVPLVKNHDTIAKCIVNTCIKHGRHSPKRPRSIRIAVFLRGILPDFVFQAIIRVLDVHKSMSTWTGR
ncbi:MAG: SDR family NAD(P)-dependent oxidoreductase [Spirochaetaceae bacterium]|nr:MAG: SDR family NAD(P)-dependent oxidoreductase [Spirochaetaceae bacterium]